MSELELVQSIALACFVFMVCVVVFGLIYNELATREHLKMLAKLKADRRAHLARQRAIPTLTDRL